MLPAASLIGSSSRNPPSLMVYAFVVTEVSSEVSTYEILYLVGVFFIFYLTIFLGLSLLPPSIRDCYACWIEYSQHWRAI